MTSVVDGISNYNIQSVKLTLDLEKKSLSN